MPFSKLYVLSTLFLASVSLTACQNTMPVNQTTVTATQQTQQAQQQSTSDNTAVSADSSMIPMDAMNIVINRLNIEDAKTNFFLKGSPEATLMQALNTLYYADVAKALGYFDNNTPNLTQKLSKFQPLLQQYTRQVVLTKADYNADKTQVKVQAQVYLSISSTAKEAEFKLIKEDNGSWKITSWQLVN
ncbi:hypothetical protein [Psychrobacter sp. I-STPA10]|uniref:hypothetical protein n=1 Tax=Psychrobacter sp. I-STPA10 TaxID=2585769 RepID=UPI001E2CAF5C|nr:hypothetical protein [Psychrobacter sp. I-STPA10]